MNPAYMTRQVHGLGASERGVFVQITSLRPLRPENAADPWEAKALRAFERGEKEAVSVALCAGENHLRLMRPLLTEQACLKCRAAQSYKVGDVRGGFSVPVPPAPPATLSRRHLAVVAAAQPASNA